MFLLLPAEYTHTTEQMNAEQFNNIIKQQQEEIARLKELHRQTIEKNCETITQLAVKHRDEMTKILEENEELKSQLADEDPVNKAMEMAKDAITRVFKENQELKRKVLLQQEAGYYHRHTSTHGDINTDDAAFDHYWSVQDNDLTLWKVPRHLAEVKSAQTGYHGAVEQAFYDECFGEEYGKLKWMRVREMTQADLIKGGWKPKTDEDDGLCGCAECEKCPSHINPYEWAEATHGAKSDCAEEELAEQDFFEGKEGGVIRWKPQAEDDEEELDSDDDDYEDKMAGKWECRRCGEKKAWSWVFDDLDCYYYCRECLDELEENSEIEKGGDAANYQYKWM